MITIIRPVITAVFFAIFSTTSFADMAHDKGLHLDHFTIRATTANAGATAAYGVIHNHSDAADRLIAARADFAAKVEIHEMVLDQDVMKMRALEDGLLIGAGEMAELKKGGLHIMLMGLKAPIKMGQNYQIELIFEKAGSVMIDAETISLREKKSHDHEAHDHEAHDHGSDHKGHGEHKQ